MHKKLKAFLNLIFLLILISYTIGLFLTIMLNNPFSKTELFLAIGICILLIDTAIR